MNKLLLLLALLAAPSYATELHLLEPRDVYIEVYSYQDMHEPYLAPLDRDILRGGAFVTDFNLLKYSDYTFYSKNVLHFDQSGKDGHIKSGGWQYELGLGLYYVRGEPKIEVFRQHHSWHIFEEERPGHFPVYDRYGVRLRIWP